MRCCHPHAGAAQVQDGLTRRLSGGPSLGPRSRVDQRLIEHLDERRAVVSVTLTFIQLHELSRLRHCSPIRRGRGLPW
jgi:hypothetical protein